jgi:hypothetical protein
MKKTLFLLIAVLMPVPGSLFAAIGTLTLDSTFASISVTLVTPNDAFEESDLVLEYQQDGESSWRTGHPLAKINGNRFIGSVFFLTEGTLYNVRVKRTACTDSSCQETGRIATKNSSFPSESGTSYYVAPAPDGSDDNPGTKDRPFLTISKAESVSQPGSVIHIAAGTYYEFITIDKSGASDAYIKYVGDPGVYISGADPKYDKTDLKDDWTYDSASQSYKTYLGYRTYFVGYSRISRVFNYRQKDYTFTDFSTLSLPGINSGYWSSDDGWLYVKLPGGIDPDTVPMQIGRRHRGILVSSASYLIFENLDLGYFGIQPIPSTPSIGISIKHGSNIIVRNCVIHHAYYGVFVSYNDSHDVLIEKNEFYDDPRFLDWPWSYNKKHDTETVAVCISGGGGNVVRDNNIHDVFNGVNPGSWGYLSDETYNFNLDVYNNFINGIGDDCIEPEGANINTRIWNNTCKDVHMGVSLAPITVGPVYIIRNKILNYSYADDTGASLKYANGGTYGGFGRIYVYHNTAYTTRNAVNTLGTIGDIGNMIYRNNIFYGDRYAFENYRYKMVEPVNWDYDCIYSRNTQPWPYYITAYWYGLTNKVNAVNLEAFRAATGQETHGIASDPLFTDLNSYNAALRESSPGIDAGAIIYGVNDRNYGGKAPDMGAIEYGAIRSPAPPSNLRSPLSSDTTAPTLEDVSASGTTSMATVITWTTSESADSQVEYGTTAGYGSSTPVNSAMVLSHSQALSSLLPATAYHYRVKSKDAAGNLATSADYTFKTAAGDSAALTISGVYSSSPTATSVYINWSTSSASNSQVEYGTTAGYGNSTSPDSAMVTMHSQALSGLTANTLYHYRVKSKDGAGNLATSGDYTFTTTGSPDSTAPTISAVSGSGISGTGISITWTTNEASDSQIEYGATTGYGSSTPLNSTMVTSHSLALGGLTPSTLYHYRVKSKDAAGNLTVSEDFTFTTTKGGSERDTGSWTLLSPTAEHKTSTFSWEGSGSFDPYNRVWIHDAGHDSFGSVQAFALWTWDIDNGGWTVKFPNNGPPGS